MLITCRQKCTPRKMFIVQKKVVWKHHLSKKRSCRKKCMHRPKRGTILWYEIMFDKIFHLNEINHNLFITYQYHWYQSKLCIKTLLGQCWPFIEKTRLSKKGPNLVMQKHVWKKNWVFIKLIKNLFPNV